MLIQSYIFDIRKLEVFDVSTRLTIIILEYTMIATHTIIEDLYFKNTYSNSGMTSKSRSRGLVGVLALILVVLVEAKGFGGIVKLSPSPSNI